MVMKQSRKKNSILTPGITVQFRFCPKFNFIRFEQLIGKLVSLHLSLNIVL
jgi:hypothetical protein